MNKLVIFLIGSFLMCLGSFGQGNGKTLFVIDSIPILKDPEEWNPILQEDIADISFIKDKDSLKLLGWRNLDAITYIFTKEYRTRPDSIKRIPSLKQMKMQYEGWHFHNKLYSGKYIDYYNNGRIQNEGTLLNGKLNGDLIVYFKNGNKKSVSRYKNGVLDGVSNDYYTNGALMQTREITPGAITKKWETFFINGQIKQELKTKKDTPYDTSLAYYSTGKIKQMTLIRNGVVIRSKKDETVNYYTLRFYQSLNTGDIKEANRAFFKIWEADSANIETYYKGGMLMLKESRFDEAIAEFDKALAIEPLMREALAHRGLARIKKHHFLKTKGLPKNGTEYYPTLEDVALIPNAEQEKICYDLQQAKFVDHSEFYVAKIVPEAIINFCEKKSNR